MKHFKKKSSINTTLIKEVVKERSAYYKDILHEVLTSREEWIAIVIAASSGYLLRPLDDLAFLEFFAVCAAWILCILIALVNKGHNDEINDRAKFCCKFAFGALIPLVVHTTVLACRVYILLAMYT